MRFSKFSYIYEIGNSKNNFYYLIRHSLLNYSYLFTEREFNQLLFNLKGGSIDDEFKDLINNHLIVPKDYSEIKFLKYIQQKNNFPFFSIFYLIFDTKCNLNCKYCYTEGSVDEEFKPQKMNKEILNETFNFLDKFISEGIDKKYIGDKVSFIFYGSEPLMNPKLLEISLKKINLLSKKFKIKMEKQIITNATLINNSIAKLIKKEGATISISLDGPKELNDLMRIFYDGKGSFESILKGINILKKGKIPFSISCTIGTHNIRYLDKVINFFKNLGAEGIGFNLLLDSRFKEISYPPNFISNKNLLDSFEISEKEIISDIFFVFTLYLAMRLP